MCLGDATTSFNVNENHLRFPVANDLDMTREASRDIPCPVVDLCRLDFRPLCKACNTI